MEKHAYEKLEDLCLPCPRRYNLENVLNENSSDKLYYLRYQHKTDLPKYVRSELIIKQLDFFRQLIAEGKIIQIEDGILSAIGGCAVTSGANTYIELVSGHLSGLLRHGWCYTRAYLNKGKIITLTPQVHMIEQSLGGNRVSPATGLSSELLGYLVDSTKTLLKKVHTSYLFEFIVDSEMTIYFVDVKNYKWEIDFASLATNVAGQDILYRRNDLADVSADIYDEDFSLDNLSKVNNTTVIRLGYRALLSHFITYSLKNGIAGIIK